jgi:alkanesulfonate monooxygenase SsuD/methylene tetrahydromethanopterin reductase-like flavin-dependent oxidoreductase (luciferase family)
MVAIIGGETRRFRPLVDIYREYGRRAGHAPAKLKVGVHALGYVAETTQQAIDDFFPVTPNRYSHRRRTRLAARHRAQFDTVRASTARCWWATRRSGGKILRHS